MPDRGQLERALAAQEALRGTVPDDVVDAAVAALRRQLHELGGSELHEQGPRRRQVTVVFADVTGFTEMSDVMDAELVADLANSIWERLDAVITEHGGFVDKHIGDAVMAIWGMDVAREDDAESALRAALAMQDALGVFRQERAVDVSMRIGVNTGSVLAGTVGSNAELTVMGDTVNVASRLAHLAEPGSVLATHEVYRHVRGVFEVEALGPIELRGKADPVEVYVVGRVKPRTFRIPSRGVEGVETRTIGRTTELQELQVAFLAAVEGRAPRVVTVVGEAGTGKSRLLSDFESWLELRTDEMWVLKGRSMHAHRQAALSLLRAVLVERFGVLDSDPVDVVIEKLVDGLAPALARTEAEIVARWLGVGAEVGTGSPGERMTDLATALLVRWLEHLTSSDPLVIVLEDIHWADVESLDVMAALVERLPTARLLVVALTRPVADEHRWPWPPSSAGRCEIALDALPPDLAGDLAREILQRVDALPDDLVDFIATRSDGNPFFAEELVKTLCDSGVIDTDTDLDRWTVRSTKFDADSIPTTLTGVLQARLDRLDAGTQRALQHASVFGRVFWAEAAAALSNEPVVESFEEARRRELVFSRDRSTFEGCHEFIFKHALVRDAVYETVLLRDREELHGRAAAWLIERAGDRVDEYLEVIADHQDRAGQIDEAADSCLRAAGVALRRGLASSARELYERALDHWNRAGIDAALEAQTGLARACRILGDLEVSAHVLDELVQGELTGEEGAELLLEACRLAEERVDPMGERELLDRALALLADCDESSVHVEVLIKRAVWESQHGDLALALEIGERAAVAAERTGDLRVRSEALGALGIIAITSGEETAIEWLRRARDLAKQSGSALSDTRWSMNLAVGLHLRGDASPGNDGSDHREALTLYREVLETSRSLGDRPSVALALINLAEVCLRLEDPTAAGHAADEALRVALALGSSRLIRFAFGRSVGVSPRGRCSRSSADADGLPQERLEPGTHGAARLRSDPRTERPRPRPDRRGSGARCRTGPRRGARTARR